MVMTLRELAEDVSVAVWGFQPDRQIKPVHFANGLVRSVTGQKGAPTLLQKAAGGFRSGRSRVTTSQFVADARDRYETEDRTQVVDRAADLRSALDLVLNQDRALFAGGPYFSLTLTHRGHASTDPSDRKTGAFVSEVLAAMENLEPLQTLRRSLEKPTDNSYVLSAPLLKDGEVGPPPSATDKTTERVRASRVLQALQQGFATVTEYEPLLEKTMFLQRVVTLLGFGLFLHLINQTERTSDEAAGLVPILLCAQNPSSELREASRAAFARARQQVERAFEEGLTRQLRSRGQDDLSAAEYRALAREWLSEEAGDGRVWSRFSQDFEGFLLGNGRPSEAFRRAVVRAAFLAMRTGGGEDPEGFSASMGRMTGLIYPRQQGRGEKYYLPAPQFLDMLVVALLKPDEEVTAEEFWDRAWTRFGVLCGSQSSLDASRLASWGIRRMATPDQLARNSRNVLFELARMGHAREYADDVAMVHSAGGVGNDY